MIKITIINDDTGKTTDEYETEKFQGLKGNVRLVHSEKLAGQYERYWVKVVG